MFMLDNLIVYFFSLLPNFLHLGSLLLLLVIWFHEELLMETLKTLLNQNQSLSWVPGACGDLESGLFGCFYL